MSGLIVVGGGMVGVCCALALQQRGLTITLVDRKSPGRETSFGNSGVLSRSSIFPINGPGLLRQLPAYIRNRHPAVRYRAAFLLRNPGWMAGFLRECTARSLDRRSRALDGLVGLSMDLNRRLIAEARLSHHLRETGWLKVWRAPDGMQAARAEADALAAFGIASEAVDDAGVRRLEPGAAPFFKAGLLITGSASVDDPGAVVAGYAELFRERGGQLRTVTVERLEPSLAGWRVVTATGALEAEKVVVALGPWSAEILAPLGLSVPLGFERGYHVHLEMPDQGGPTRAIYDVDGGYVVSPMRRGARVTSGVELSERDAPARRQQIDAAVMLARATFDLGDRLDAAPWLGARPTLPDCLPMIGPVPRHPGLYAAFAHQHIGFSTGAATGAIIAAQVTGDQPPIDARPFSPARYIR